MEVITAIDLKNSQTHDDSPIMKIIKKINDRKKTRSQRRAITKGRNVVVRVQSPASRTVFSIAALQNINTSLLECQMLVLVADKQMVLHTITTIGEAASPMNIVCYAVGLLNMQKDIYELKNGVHAIVGTPGTVNELISINAINTRKIKMCVLEEPDVILLKTFINKLNSDVQIILLVTFLPQCILEQCTSLLKNPLSATINKQESILENTKQCYVSVLEDENKFDMLLQLHRTLNISRAIVFCSTDHTVSVLVKNLKDCSLSVFAINDGMSAEAKDSILQNLSSCDKYILVTKHMLKNNIFQQLPVVINYDLPVTKRNYAKRIRAVNRCTRNEIVINFVSGKEKPLLQEVENCYGIKIEEISLNNGTFDLSDRNIQNDTEMPVENYYGIKIDEISLNNGTFDLNERNIQNDIKMPVNRSRKKRMRRRDRTLLMENEDITNYSIQNFQDLNLHEKLAQRLQIFGLMKPNPLQQRAVLPCLNGRDVIIEGPPGSGKMTAVSIAVLQNTDTLSTLCQVLVMVSTRQMAPKVLKALNSFGVVLGVKCHASVGGSNVREDIAKLKKGVHVVVGTVGRIHDLIQRNVLRTEHIKTFVIVDVNDTLLIEKIYDIFRKLHSNIQIITLSPNTPNKALKSFQIFLKKPVYIMENYSMSSLENVKQLYIPVATNELKLKVLLKLYKKCAMELTVIFCNRKADAEWLATQMQNEGIEASALHADMDDINGIINKFRSVTDYTLITTDMFVGAEVNGVSVVINYDLPPQRGNFVRRISTCSNSGNEITAISLVRDDEKKAIKKIKEMYEIQMTKMTLQV